MGNKRNAGKIWKMLLYILIVILLIGCLGFLYGENRKRKAAYRDEVQEMAQNETEYVREERLEETEEQTEKQTEKKSVKPAVSTKKETEKKQEKEETESETEPAAEAVSEEQASESEMESEDESDPQTKMPEEAETESESESESESELESEDEDDGDLKEKSMRIVLLNASGREGAAAMWKEELEDDGFQKLSIGSFSHKEEGTTIYTRDSAVGEALRKIFPNSNVNTSGMESVRAEIEDVSSVQYAKTAVAYVVIGKNNTEIFH